MMAPQKCQLLAPPPPPSPTPVSLLVTFFIIPLFPYVIRQIVKNVSLH